MTAPGWHPDPQDPRQLRWWDGTTWTAHVSPAAPAAPVATGAPGAPSGSPGLPFGAAPTPAPKASVAPLVLIVGGAIAVSVLVVVIAAVVIFATRSDPTTASTAATTPTTHPAGHPTTTESGTGSDPDEAPDDEPLADRAEQADVPLLDEEGAATHTHSMLHIVVDGEPVRIPADVGIDARRGKIAALHTHEPFGVLHVESPTRGDTYTLGQFLALWGRGGDQDAICAAFADGPCDLTVQVVAPTTEDELEFDGFGPMPTEPAVDAFGLDTELAQGAVIVVTITST